MMRITLLIIIVSANCVKMKCDEELNTTENLNGVSEKTELKSGDNETLQSNTESKENEKEVSKSSETNEEIRISRSSSEHSTEKVLQPDNISKLLTTEASLTEKSTYNEKNTEKQDSQVDKEVKQLTRRMNSPEATKEVEKSSENMEKHLEELPKTSTAAETEDRKPEDLSEASSESKLIDSEKASSNVDVTDRKSKTEDIEEKSNDLLLNENRGTRRMFSATDNIVIDSKMRSGTTSTVPEPEVKTALKQNFNTYNNYNEFDTADNIELIDPSRSKPSTIVEKTKMPVIAKLAPEEVFDQQYMPKFYPRPELDIVFPNVNSDFQGPLDLPIYLNVKQDENQFKGPPTSHVKSVHRNYFYNPNNQQQNSDFQGSRDLPIYLKIKQDESQFKGQPAPRFEFAHKNNFYSVNNQQQHPPQKSLRTQEMFSNKQLENLENETRNQAAKLYQNLNQGSRNQFPQHYQNQEKNRNYNNFGNINLDVRNENVQQTCKNCFKGNSKMPLNYKDSGNQYPYHEPQEMIQKEIKFEHNHLGTERFTSPNSYLLQPIPQQVTLNDPRNNIDIIPANVKMLFQKLARASLFPRKLTTNVDSGNNIQNPYLMNAGFTADIPVYGLGYIPDF